MTTKRERTPQDQINGLNRKVRKLQDKLNWFTKRIPGVKVAHELERISLLVDADWPEDAEFLCRLAARLRVLRCGARGPSRSQILAGEDRALLAAMPPGAGRPF